MRQALLGLGHLHARGVIHKDVKPSNFLVMREGHVVVSDFDISTDRTVSDRTSTGRGVVGQGTHGYMAPEVLEGGAHSKASDMYSFGVSLAELALERLPTSPELQSLGRGSDGSLTQVDPDLRKLLRSLLTAAPARRLDAEVCEGAQGHARAPFRCGGGTDYQLIIQALQPCGVHHMLPVCLP